MFLEKRLARLPRPSLDCATRLTAEDLGKGSFGRSAGNEFCATGSRISPEVWVADSAWMLRKKGALPTRLCGALAVRKRLCHYDWELCAQACFSKLS